MVLRGLLPLALVGLCWWLLQHKRVSAFRVIGVVFVLGIDLTYLGLAGWSVPPLFSAEWFAFLGGGSQQTPFAALGHLWPPLVATACLAAVYWVGKSKE